VYNHARHAITALSQGIKGRLNNKLRSKFGEINNKEQMMAKFTQLAHSVSIAVMIASLSGCGEGENKVSTPPVPTAHPLTVGGSASGLAGGELVLQLNGGDDLTVKADGEFKFPKPLTKGSAYAVTVKTSPALPVKQTCTVSQGSGSIAGSAVNNVTVACTTNTYAVGGTVSGLSGKGLVLELKGGKEVKIAKNGNFIFPDTRLPDGSDYNVAIKTTPAGQKCIIKAIATAPDSDTMNIVAVTCKKGRR
jgi:large repetitive protein